MFGMMPGWGASFEVAPSNPLLLCHFDGSNGETSFVDSSSYARSLTTVSPASLTTSYSKFGPSSLDCGGGRVYVDDSTMFNFGTTAFSIVCWYRDTGTTLDRQFLFGAAGPVGSGSTLVFAKLEGGVPFFSVRKQDTTLLTFVGAETIPSQGHVYIGRSGASLYFAINGVIQSVVDIGSSAIADVTGSFAIGGLGQYTTGGYGSTYGDRWIGQVDEFAVFPTALWTSNFTPPTSPYSV